MNVRHGRRVLARPSWLALVGCLASLVVPRSARAWVGDDPVPPPAYATRAVVLTQVTATVRPDGSATYTFQGYHPGIVGISFNGQGAFQPSTGRAQERLDFPGGRVQTTTTCQSDPWMTLAACDRGTYNANGNAPTTDTFFALGAPVGAQLLSAESRNKVSLAYMDAKKSWTPTPTRTPVSVVKRMATGDRHLLFTPTRGPLTGVKAGALSASAGKIGNAGGGSSAGGGSNSGGGSPPPPAPLKSSGPAYGATYAPGQAPAYVRVGQTFAIPVLVTNTSSQTWPAGGPFRLGYHWVLNGQVTDGEKAPLPLAVPSGGSATVNATVRAPLLNGRWTLRWDMHQEGGGWFSAKAVPAKDQAVTISP